MLFLESVEVSAVMHCNLRCEGCNHDAPSMAPWFADPDVVFRDLQRLGTAAQVETVRVVGGEPLLHPQLGAILQAARASGIAKSLSLFTNGLLVARIDPSIWEQLDHVRLTIYPQVRETFPLMYWRELAVQHQINLDVVPCDSFTMPFRETPCVDARPTFTSCGLRRRCHAVHEGRFFQCPQVMVLAHRPGTAIYADMMDSVALGQRDLQQVLQDYLSRIEAFTACRFCYGTDGAVLHHRFADALKT